MNKSNDQRKPMGFAKRTLLQITISLVLFSAIYLSQRFLPEVFLYIKSNLTYTPDLTPVNEAVKTFIINHSPN